MEFGGKVVDEGTEKEAFIMIMPLGGASMIFSHHYLSFSEYQLPGKEDDGQGRGKKKKKNSSHHKQDIVYSTICPVD